MNNYIESLNWRYATKEFDTTRKVSTEDLDRILESIQLSASSYGLQPYEILVIEDPEVREKLKSAAWNQNQLTEASHVLVFASYTCINEKYISSYLSNISATRKVPKEDLYGFLKMLQNTVLKLSNKEQTAWAAKQAYLAMGNFLSAAANFRIDSCPMEGFEADKFDEILGLKEKGLTTTVIAPIGYRSENDKTQHVPKVRKSKKQLFHLI